MLGDYHTIKDLTCTFRASCYSARLSWALVITWVSPFVQDKVLGDYVDTEFTGCVL